MPGIGIGISPMFNRRGSSSFPSFQNIGASGGIITYAGGRKIHTFINSDETFDVFYVPSGVSINRLIVGGAGAGKSSSRSGGASSGQVIYDEEVAISPGSYPLTIGNGGVVNDTINTNGQDGEDTVFMGITALRGRGAGYSGSNGTSGYNGSGGGNAGGLGGVGTNYSGGIGTDFYSTGGGAGQAGPGGNGSGGFTGIGGTAGLGFLCAISGIDVYYGCGAPGSGIFESGDQPCAGGAISGYDVVAATSPDQNTGNAGGSGWDGPGTSGADGVVIVSYPWAGPEINYGYDLISMNSNISTVPAMDSSSLIWYENEWHLIDGWNPSAFAPNDSTSGHWTSPDLITWTFLGDGSYSLGHGSGIAVRNDGYIWMWGSTDVGTFLVKKYSTATGWTVVSEVPIGSTISAVGLGCNFYHNGYMYRMGGQDGAMPAPMCYTDVERSSDGITWTSVGTTPTANFCSATAISDGTTIYAGGGGRYITGSPPDMLNTKIWKSTDHGATWTEHCDLIVNQQTLWPTLQIFDGKLFYLTGTDGVNLVGLYYYRNSQWILMESPTARHASPMAVNNTEMAIVTGNLHNDSYKLISNQP